MSPGYREALAGYTDESDEPFFEAAWADRLMTGFSPVVALEKWRRQA